MAVLIEDATVADIDEALANVAATKQASISEADRVELAGILDQLLDARLEVRP